MTFREICINAEGADQHIVISGGTWSRGLLGETMSFLAGRPLHAFLVRKEPKGHGTNQWVERGRRLEDGAPVVIVEDVVTTGASTLRAIERARGAGFDVVHVVALVDRLEGGREAVEAQAPLTALFTRKDFLP